PSKSNIYVQAGSFSSEQNAINLRHKLSGLGNATVSKALVNGQTFYRVRLGPVATVPQSDALLAKVRQAGVTEARTIVD
ncbi:MAG: SPOR domain-containing protein, partial [Alphaproteobacteria bacterium]|nr:SPOR domain-containing protein [Alphaproteobacteria bacterium]